MFLLLLYLKVLRNKQKLWTENHTFEYLKKYAISVYFGFLMVKEKAPTEIGLVYLWP
jgi:hypothetical protein